MTQSFPLYIQVQFDDIKSQLDTSNRNQQCLQEEVGSLRRERIALSKMSPQSKRQSLRRIAIANSSQSSTCDLEGGLDSDYDIDEDLEMEEEHELSVLPSPPCKNTSNIPIGPQAIYVKLALSRFCCTHGSRFNGFTSNNTAADRNMFTALQVFYLSSFCDIPHQSKRKQKQGIHAFRGSRIDS